MCEVITDLEKDPMACKAVARGRWGGGLCEYRSDIPLVGLAQISIITSMGMPYEKHRGGVRDAVGMHVGPAYGPAKRDSFPFMAVRCA